jgi:hypothetical protein
MATVLANVFAIVVTNVWTIVHKTATRLIWKTHTTLLTPIFGPTTLAIFLVNKKSRYKKY